MRSEVRSNLELIFDVAQVAAPTHKHCTHKHTEQQTACHPFNTRHRFNTYACTCTSRKIGHKENFE